MGGEESPAAQPDLIRPQVDALIGRVQKGGWTGDKADLDFVVDWRLWADELATWGAVRVGWTDLFRLSRHVDVVVTPYYVVEKAWTSLAGTSTVALRLPSMLAMVAAAALVAVLAATLRDRWTGLLAGSVFAVIPATSRFAQEARPYAFVVLLAVLATLLLIRLRQGGGTAVALGYALCVALIGLLHLIGLLLLPAHAVVARRRLATWAVWAGTGLLPLSCSVPFSMWNRS